MADYHVRNMDNGRIYAGIFNKKGNKFSAFSDVTDETLASARNHLLDIAKKDGKEVDEVGCYWPLTDGRLLCLTLKVVEKDFVAEKAPEQQETASVEPVAADTSSEQAEKTAEKTVELSSAGAMKLPKKQADGK